MEPVILLISLVCGILLAGFYAGIETGTYGLNRMRLRLHSERGEAAAISLSTLMRRPETVIATALVGHNLAVWFTTSLTTLIFSGLSPGNAELLTSATLSPILFVFAEVVPKELYRRQAEVLSYDSARVLWISARAFALPVAALRAVALGMAKLIGAQERMPEQVFSRVRLLSSLGEGRAVGVLTAFQSELAHNIVELRDQSLKAVMVPLEEVALLPNTKTRDEAQQLARERRFFRYPVYRGKPENIVGIVNIVDLWVDDRPGLTIRNYIREVPKVHEGAGIEEALAAIRAARQPLAIVIDGEDRALGIVTAKDLLEEITGELESF